MIAAIAKSIVNISIIISFLILLLINNCRHNKACSSDYCASHANIVSYSHCLTCKQWRQCTNSNTAAYHL